jgi:hypothetical protein
MPCTGACNFAGECNCKFNVIGLDPGGHGAMAVITPDMRLQVFCFAHYSPKQIADKILDFKLFLPGPTKVCLEQVHGRRGDFVNHAFTFGKNTGRVEGFLIAAGFEDIEEVPPKTWQYEFGLGSVPPNIRKNKHKDKAQALFPNTRVTLDMADAILIALYAWRKHNARLLQEKGIRYER